MELISVIVPVYKVERYIDECIESIRNQTYSDLEIVLVDDGSPDSCPSICDNYARKDDRIKVIHKKNGGLSSARNIGIKESLGQYITFVDSDDVLDFSMIETLYCFLKKENTDIAICSMKRTVDVYDNPIKRNMKIFSGKEACEEMYEPDYSFFVAACGKIYKREVFNDIRFPEGRIHEDDFTMYKVFLRSRKVLFVNLPMYFYRSREGSITSSQFSEKNFDRYDALDQQLHCFKKMNMSKAYKGVLSRYLYLLICDQKKSKNYKLRLKIRKRYKHILSVSKNSGLFSSDEIIWFTAPHNYRYLTKIYWISVALKDKFELWRSNLK